MPSITSLSSRPRTARTAVLVGVLCLGLPGVLAAPGCRAAKDVMSKDVLSRTYADGNEAYASGEYAVALAKYQQILDRRPQSATANHDVGRALLALDRPGEAAEPLAVAHELRSSDPTILRDYATALNRAERTDELLTVLNRISHERRDVPQTLVLAGMCADLGFPDDAERAIREAIVVDGDKTTAPRIALAQLYLSVNDEARAVEQLRYALWIDQNDPTARDLTRQLGQIPGPTFARPPAAVTVTQP